MKTLKLTSFACLLSLMGGTLFGQAIETDNGGKHPQSWQIGVIISDFLYPKLAGETSFYIDDRHSLGIYAAFHGQRYEQVYDEINSNYSVGMFHRIVFNKPNDLSMFFLKYGARYSNANLSYTKTDWFPYTDDGYEFLVYEERELTENPISLSYQIAFGYQEVSHPFYLEYYLGINYHSIINKGDLDPDHKVQRNQFFVDSQWLREGFSPILGVVVGLGTN